MPIKNLFSLTEDSNDISQLNLDDPELIPYLKNIQFPPTPNTIPDLLSLFYHNSHTEVEKNTDLSETDIKQRRYFADTLVCYECGKTGHMNKNCPQRIRNLCILCARKGHDRRNCPMMVCHKCYLLGHSARLCPLKDNRQRFILCRVCKSGEHSVRDCPRSWREYRVESLDFTKRVKKSCCICFSDQHYVDDCKKNKTRFSIFNSDFMSIVRLYKK